MRHFRFFPLCVILTLLALSWQPLMAERVLVTATYKDNTMRDTTITLQKQPDGALRFQWKQEALRSIKFMTVRPDFAHALPGDSGYFLHPDGRMVKFLPRDLDYDLKLNRMPLPIFGLQTRRGTYMGYIKGLRFESWLHSVLKNGVYSFYVNLELAHVNPYEDYIIDFYPLRGKDATYSGMGRLYRRMQLESGAVIPLRERIKNNPTLAYAVQSPLIRIRQGWKPVPTPVVEQTPETEPPMKVRVTFDRVKDIVNELKRQGIRKADLTLVGWNHKGHDGRFPTLFPVEPTLGGEKKLKSAIRHAQKNGYMIAAHVCNNDSYRISPDWDEADVAKNPDASLSHYKGAVYGSGNMYNLCYQASFQKFVAENNRRTAALGFKGMHYIDVISTVLPTVCYDPHHPLNRKEAALWANKHLQAGRDAFGGVSSEGGYDFVAGSLDYALYITFNLNQVDHDRLIDDYIPLWHIVYDGIIMSCPGSAAINYTIKNPSVRLKVIEYGCRPSFYFYAAHRDDDKNWMGDQQTDLFCATDAELQNSVRAIRQGWDDIQALGDLQLEFLDDHQELIPHVYRSTFSNGAEIICNYTDTPFTYKGQTVAAQDWKRF
ncbi:MAG: hypothetical protein ILA34_00535 [Bacteroidaceae bacterium]|nr:hypothetical protein [Bacteroidaceae bacterium]